MFRRKKNPNKKLSKRQIELITEFENGKVLQVDNGKDNKKHFNSIKQ